MWVSEDGRTNTNAWGDPAAALPASVLALLSSVSDADRERLLRALDFNDDLFDEIDAFIEATDADTEAPFVREWMPPDAIAHLRGSSIDELIHDIQALDLRWRLDAFGVLEQYLDRD